VWWGGRVIIPRKLKDNASHCENLLRKIEDKTTD